MRKGGRGSSSATPVIVNSSSVLFFFFHNKEAYQKLTPSIFMQPLDIGSITFSGTTYIDGQSGEYVAGTYQIEADVPKRYIFYNQIATGRFSVANSESQQTNGIVI